MIVYLHGFRSTPRSLKATQLAQRMKDLGRSSSWMCPQLPVSPAEAIALLTGLIEPHANTGLCLIGSSLGGYYATFLAERYGCKAVVLNPAVTPHQDLSRYLGEQTVYGSSETIFVKPDYLGELQALWVDQITRPARYFLIAATGDEVIDWQLMAAKYRGAQMRIVEGSDHGLSDFASYLEEVLEFADRS